MRLREAMGCLRKEEGKGMGKLEKWDGVVLPVCCLLGEEH